MCLLSASFLRHFYLTVVVIRRGLEGQKNRPGVTAPPDYCMAICFYYEALGHMFLLVGCGRGARPYVSAHHAKQKNRLGVTKDRRRPAIVWPYVSIVWRSAICFYWLAVGVGLGHMFLLCGARPYVSIGWLWAWG